MFQQSYKGWRGKFFIVCCTDHDRTTLDDFPLYWVKEPGLTKPKSLDELPSTDREVCLVLASVGVLDTAELIEREYDSAAFIQYLSMGTTPHSPSSIFDSASVYSCQFVNCLSALGLHLGQSTFSVQLVTPSRWATPMAIEALQWSTPEPGDAQGL